MSRPNVPCGLVVRGLRRMIGVPVCGTAQNPVSRRMTAQDRGAGAMASNWAEAFEKLQSQDSTVQRRPAEARASRRVEKLQEAVAQDGAADRPTLPARTSTLAEAVEKLRRRKMALSAHAAYVPAEARGEKSRTMAADARGRRVKMQPTPSWEELEERLRRSQEALKARVAVANRAEPAELVRPPGAPSETSTSHATNDPAAPQTA